MALTLESLGSCLKNKSHTNVCVCMGESMCWCVNVYGVCVGVHVSVVVGLFVRVGVCMLVGLLGCVYVCVLYMHVCMWLGRELPRVLRY